MTPGQERAYQAFWHRYGLAADDGLLQASSLFGRSAPLVLEIGFGMGASLAAMAVAAPETDFIGIEVHRPGVGKLMALAAEAGLTNLRVYHHDAVEVLQRCIPESSLSRVQIYFPDPWHKKKHHKRRLVQADFADLLRSRLRPQGLLHLATDWFPYAQHMLEVLDACAGLANVAGTGQFTPRPGWRPETKFERRGERLGHGTWDLLYRRQD